MNLILSIWRFRHFILRKTKNDLQVQFSKSGLGYLWLILTPAALIATYIFVFSEVMKAKLPGVDDTVSYGVYLCSGVVFWTSFSNMLSKMTQIFIAENALLKEMYVPASVLPISVMVGELFQLLIFSLVFLAFLIVVQNVPGVEALYLIPIVIIQFAFVLGVGLILGILNAFIRDFGHSLGIILHFWFWLTPIVYPVEILPPWAQFGILKLNPMTAIIEGYHTIFVHHKAPDLLPLLSPAILAVVLLGIGLFMFRRVSTVLGELS